PWKSSGVASRTSNVPAVVCRHAKTYFMFVSPRVLSPNPPFTWSTANAATASLSERVQRRVGADVELAVHEGGRGVDRFTQVIPRQHLELVARRQDDHHAVARAEEDLAVAGDRRGEEGAAGAHPLATGDLAGLRLQAGGDAAVLHQVDVFPVE